MWKKPICYAAHTIPRGGGCWRSAGAASQKAVPRRREENGTGGIKTGKCGRNSCAPRHEYGKGRSAWLWPLLVIGLFAWTPAASGAVAMASVPLKFGQVLQWLKNNCHGTRHSSPSASEISFCQSLWLPQSRARRDWTKRWGFKAWVYQKGIASVVFLVTSDGIPVYWASNGKNSLAMTVSAKHPHDLLLARNLNLHGGGPIRLGRRAYKLLRLSRSLNFRSGSSAKPANTGGGSRVSSFGSALPLGRNPDFPVRRFAFFLRSSLKATRWLCFKTRPRPRLELFRPSMLGGAIISVGFHSTSSHPVMPISSIRIYGSRHGEFMLRPVLVFTHFEAGHNARPLTIVKFCSPKISGFQIQAGKPVDIIMAALPGELFNSRSKPTPVYLQAVRQLCQWALGHPLAAGKTPAKKIAWVRSAALAGNSEAMYTMGRRRMKGDGVRRDYHKAIAWFKKAATAGSSNAACGIGEIYAKGFGIKRNYRKAMAWSRKAADEGNAIAMSNIFVFYDKGWGVARSYKKALAWARKSAAAGDARAMGFLGLLYYDGHGVRRDYRRAFAWWKKAANCGNVHAMMGLASLYYYGEGVPKDHQKTNYWCEKAADAGNAEAKAWLNKHPQ